MRRALLNVAFLAAMVVGAAAWWRRHPRFGAEWVTRVVDPWLVKQGVIAGSNGELGLLEHVGRKSGTVRSTPIRPVPTADGFRIVVPLGVSSQWAQNVLAAGHCRLQVDDVIHELDEPRLVVPSDVEGLPKPATRVMDWLGFRYLVLHEFGQLVGSLDRADVVPQPVSTESASREAVPAAS